MSAVRILERILVAAVALLFVAGSAGAATITFNGVNGGGNNTVSSTTDGGFDFNSSHHHVIDNPGLCAFGGCVNNGTNYIAEEDGALGGNITMSRSGGGTFTLNALDVAQLFNNDLQASAGGFPNADVLRIIGSNGAVVTVRIPDVGFGTVGGLGATFSNVTFVTFVGINYDWKIRRGGAIALDNLVVDRTVIPEPSSAILFGAAWLAAGVALRRKA